MNWIMNSTLTQTPQQNVSSANPKETTQPLKYGQGDSWYSEENTKRYVERFADSNGNHK